MDIRNEELISLISNQTPIKSEIMKLNSGHTPKKLVNKKKRRDFSKFKREVLEDHAINYLPFEKHIHS